MKSALACVDTRVHKPHLVRSHGIYSVFKSSQVYKPWLAVARDFQNYLNGLKS